MASEFEEWEFTLPDGTKRFEMVGQLGDVPAFRKMHKAVSCKKVALGDDRDFVPLRHESRHRVRNFTFGDLPPGVTVQISVGTYSAEEIDAMLCAWEWFLDSTVGAEHLGIPALIKLREDQGTQACRYAFVKIGAWCDRMWREIGPEWFALRSMDAFDWDGVPAMLVALDWDAGLDLTLPSADFLRDKIEADMTAEAERAEAAINEAAGSNVVPLAHAPPSGL